MAFSDGEELFSKRYGRLSQKPPDRTPVYLGIIMSVGTK